MLNIYTTRILGSTCAIGSSILCWISYHQHYPKSIKPIQLNIAKQDNIHDEPFSSKSIDQTIQRGEW